MQIASYHRHVSKQRAVAVAADGGAAPAPPSSRAAAAAVATEAAVAAAGGVAATHQHGHNFARDTPWKRRTAGLALLVLSVSQVRKRAAAVFI